MHSGKAFRLSVTISVVALIALMTGLLTPGYAQVKPGDFITPESATKVKDLVAPGVYYKVERGMTMKITPTERIDWPPPYKDATEKYSAQVRLTSDHRSLLGYVAGQPFPLIDANDHDVGVRSSGTTCFARSPATTMISGSMIAIRSIRRGVRRPLRPSTSKSATTPATTWWDGPKSNRCRPTRISRSTGRLWIFGLYPVLAPQELHGIGFIRWRYADAKKGDDTWSLNAGSRRIRRVDESILSSAVTSGTAAFSWDPDHYSGFNAKTEEYDYKFVGEKNMLGSMHASHSPEVRCPTDGGASACPENWEMRHLYVLDATPRPGHINAIDSRSLIYLDSEMWFEPYIDTYDRAGKLFRSHIYWLAYRDRPVPDARVAIYPFKRGFVVAAVSTDVQSGQATMCYLPGIETPEKECWYINMGAVDKSFFTTDAMVRAANM